MPDNDIHAAEVRLARAEARVAALEQREKRDKARAKQQPDRARAAKEKVLKPSRLTRGLAETDPSRKGGRK